MLENPFAVLGIEVGATLAQVQAAYRRLAKDCHPDRQPDDPEAAAKFRAITKARDTILEMKGRCGSARRSGTDAPPPRAGPSWTFWEVTAPAGAGKTREWAYGVAQPPDRRRMDDPTAVVSTIWLPRRPLRIILASVTIDLFMETAKALAEFEAGNVTVIHSRTEASGGQTVNQKLGKYFGDLKAGQDAILLCTHTAVAALPVKWRVRAKRGGPERLIFAQAEWDLTIDEAPDVITFLERSWPETHSVITRHVDATPFRGDLLRLTPLFGSERHLRLLGRGGEPNRDDGYTSFAEPAAAIADRTRVVLVDRRQWESLINGQRNKDLVYGGALDLAVVLRPELFQHYRSATMMGARLPTTMAHVLWSKLSNVDYRPHPLQARLMPRHTAAQGKRLQIFYVFEEPATRQFLARKAEDGNTMFRSMCDRIAMFFGKLGNAKKASQFVWTAPLDRPGSSHSVASTFFEPARRGGYQAFHPSMRLPGRTHGLNKFRKYDNAALLSVTNFTPAQYDMLGALGLSDDEINRAFGRNIIYQDALRCSLRDRNGRGKVTIVVPDRAAAENLGQDFPGCRIEALPPDLVPVAAAKRRPGPRRTASSTSTDRVRAKRARDRAAKDRADETTKDRTQ